ncbi:MAG: hypothetical protein RIS47_709, partial [Bacteroidota bacterium]
MKVILRYTLVLVALIVFFGLFYVLYQKGQEKPEVVETTSPTMDTIVKKTVATGSIVPRKEIEIKPKVSGIIEELYVEAGKMVKTGDVLAKVKVIPDMLSLNNAETRLENAKLSLDLAQTEYDRQKSLFDKKVIAEADFLTAKNNYSKAKAEVESSENNLQLIKEGSSKKMGKVTNTLIKATVSGMVLSVPVEAGNSVTESNTFNDGTTIATIANMQDMIFKGKVDESEVGKLSENMELVLVVGAIENQKFTAKLEHIAPKGVAENGAIQFEIKATVVLKPGQFIRAGYSANADIVLDKRENVLTINESLISFRNDSAFVQVQTKPMIFAERQIKTGLSDGINVEVLSGIKLT